ncbi:MAG: hypothetical protein JXR80_02915, partial [Deltaproteobacteria bacterium]|nr:hypothetical protein [Deltaproteobacteria bacterium]
MVIKDGKSADKGEAESGEQKKSDDLVIEGGFFLAPLSEDEPRYSLTDVTDDVSVGKVRPDETGITGKVDYSGLIKADLSKTSAQTVIDSGLLEEQSSAESSVRVTLEPQDISSEGPHIFEVMQSMAVSHADSTINLKSSDSASEGTDAQEASLLKVENTENGLSKVVVAEGEPAGENNFTVSITPAKVDVLGAAPAEENNQGEKPFMANTAELSPDTDFSGDLNVYSTKSSNAENASANVSQSIAAEDLFENLPAGQSADSAAVSESVSQAKSDAGSEPGVDIADVKDRPFPPNSAGVDFFAAEPAAVVDEAAVDMVKVDTNGVDRANEAAWLNESEAVSSASAASEFAEAADVTVVKTLKVEGSVSAKPQVAARDLFDNPPAAQPADSAAVSESVSQAKSDAGSE